MTLWNCWIVVRLFLIAMIGGISYKRRQWLIWGYGDTLLPSLRTRGPKCHTSWAKMSHKGQNVTQSCYNYKLRPVSRKMWQFNFKMDIEGQLWRHTVTSSVTSSTLKVLLGGLFLTIFPYLMSQLTYIKYFEIFKMAAILRLMETLNRKLYRKLSPTSG